MPQFSWRSWTLMVLWRPTRHSRTNTPKRCPFHYRRLECTSRKSRNTWSNRQICPWSTEWSRAKVNRVLPREHTDHSKYPLPTIQEKTLHMDITRWSIHKSDNHNIYYCGQESLRRNGVAMTINKSLKCSTWMQSQKRQKDECLFPRKTIQYHSNPSLYPDK